MQTSIIKYSETKKEDRLESEYYQKKFQILKEQFEKIESKKLSDLVLKKITTGHTPSMKNDKFYGGYTKFIKTDNLRDNYIKDKFSHYLSDLGNNEIKSTILQEGDIITTIIGATHDVIARSCIIRKNMLPANINQNICLIRVDRNKINLEFLNTFLNSKYGKMWLHYFSRQTEQVNLNCREVGQIQIPLFSEKFQKNIEDMVLKAHAERENANTLTKEAQTLLEKELGIYEWTPTKQKLNTSIKKHSETTQANRIDAEYYQEKYDAILKKITSYKGGYKAFGDLIVDYSTGFAFDSKSYTSEGVPVIRINNIKKGELDLTKPAFVNQKIADLAIKDSVNINDLLISMSGTIGNCCKVEKNQQGIINQRIIRIKINDYNQDVLTLLINSIIGSLQLDRIGTGGVQTNISSKDIFEILIPILDKKIQDEIAIKITNAHQARQESKRLLELAKSTVEHAIEHGE